MATECVGHSVDNFKTISPEKKVPDSIQFDWIPLTKYNGTFILLHPVSFISRNMELIECGGRDGVGEKQKQPNNETATTTIPIPIKTKYKYLQQSFSHLKSSFKNGLLRYI